MTSERPDHDEPVPFIATTDHGGPYDPDGFNAGWQASRAYHRLVAARAVGLGLYEDSYPTALLPQIDLLAMSLGARLTPVQEADGWTRVRLAWAES